MTADPITLAREVLGGSDESDDRFLDFYEARNIAQTLARAVIRVAELTDNPDSEAGFLREMGVHATDHGLYAHRIRTALNGENHD